MKSMVLLLVLASLLAGSLHAQPRPDDVFAYLNLDYPGLEKVRAAYVAKDFAGARNELLRYYRERTNRNADFRTFLPPADVLKAEENAKNIVNIKTYRHDFGAVIDWTKTQEDREWQYSLARMEWFLNYAVIFEKTSNDRFVSAWMRQIESWIAIGDPGYPRTIDTGRRMENWLVSYWMFVRVLKAEAVTPEFNALFLASMAQQAEFIYQPEHWRKYSNWGSFETSGMALFTALFPEYQRSADWMKEVFFRMRTQLANSYYTDGMHVEAAPSYHLHELLVWQKFLKLVVDNAIDDPWKPQADLPAYRELIVPKARSFMHLMKPTGYMPQVGDSDQSDEISSLLDIAEYWNDPEILYVATNGARGVAPAKTTLSYPEGGYTVLRSGWGTGVRPYAKELYLLFDHGSNKPWHGHLDAFNIHVTGYGHDLLVDPGRFTYNEDETRRQFVSTAFHNTIVVDSQSQQKTFRGTSAEMHEVGAGTYVSGEQNSYRNVAHRRSIFFAGAEYWILIDRLRSSTAHQYEQYWHFDESALGRVKVEQDPRLIRAPHLLLLPPPAGEITLEESVFSRHYRQKEPAPVIRIRQTGISNAVLPTVIYPVDEGGVSLKQEILQVLPLEDPGARVRLKITGSGWVDYYGEGPSGDGKGTALPLSSDGRMVYLRTDPEGKVKSAAMIGGSYIRYRGKDIVRLDGGVADVGLTGGEMDLFGESITGVSADAAYVHLLRHMGERVVGAAANGKLVWRR